MLLSQSLQKVEAPKAATSSRSVLAGIMNTPASMRRYKVWKVAAGGARANKAPFALQPSRESAAFQHTCCLLLPGS